MPLAAISFQSAREKSIRHGHLSTLHIWWARRPLAACRAAIFAALVPEPEDPVAAKKMQAFIAQLANWDNSKDSTLGIGKEAAHTCIQDARTAIRAAFPDRLPRILDPFTGGGAIPLEALRLGCETHALDLNPVAHIIQLATLVFPQKYAKRPGIYGDKPGATLVGDVRKWGAWVLEQAYREIGDLYPKDHDGATTVACLWARTVRCPNPSCSSDVPMIRQTWLARKSNRNIAYEIETDGPGSVPRFRIVGPVATQSELGFDPDRGTARGGNAVCPCCGTPIVEKYIKSEAVAQRLGAIPVAVITDSPGKQGKRYRKISSSDEWVIAESARRLREIQGTYDPFSGDLSPVPDEPIPTNDVFNVRMPIYGLMTWASNFNERQLVALTTFVRLVRKAYDGVLNETGDGEYAKAIATYMAILVDRLADYNSTVCQWQVSGEQIGHTFGRQAIPMTWDYVDLNPFSGMTGDWDGAIDWVRRVIEHCAAVSDSPADVRRGTATDLPFEDGSIDAIVTDPPYYNNVGYSSLADFFYVWLKRTIGDLYPSVLGAPTVPKEQEIVEGGQLHRSKDWFETELGKAFAECARVLRDDGICVVVYAHKAISAWETLVGALLRAGLSVDASWPFSTEMAARQMAFNKATLASSIFLVCRKRKTDAGIGIAGDVRWAIASNVRERLDAFWIAGLRGADFFISAIGPATAAFSRYDKVMTLGGAEITVSTLLEWVQETVADYALQRVFATAAFEQGVDATDAGLGTVDDQTRFYVLWRWTYDGVAGSVNGNGGATSTVPTNGDEAEDPEAMETAAAESPSGGKTKKIPFGDAHLMATALGADINDLLHRYHILEGAKDVKLLDARDRAEKIADFGERRADGSRPPLVDILHRVELLWATNQRALLTEYLDELSPDDREALRRVAQALVDLLPRGDSEKQRLEGFLSSGVARDDGTSSGGTRPQPSVQLGLGGEIAQEDVVRRPHGKGRR